MVKTLQRKIALGSGNRCDLITREEKKDRERCDDAGRVFDDNTKGLSLGKDQRESGGAPIRRHHLSDHKVQRDKVAQEEEINHGRKEYLLSVGQSI